MLNKLKKFSLMIVAASSITSCAQNTNKEENSITDKKILVTFFSRTGENYAVGNISKGNTHIIADFIADNTGAEVFEIKPIIPYPEDYTKCTEIAKEEVDTKARPEIAKDKKIEDYDVIFIGYPNWWGDMPMPVYTFIEKHNWEGKTVIPFCTHEGSGLGSTPEYLKNSCKGANILNGLAIRGSVAQNSQEKAKEEVKNWLKQIGL